MRLLLKRRVPVALPTLFLFLTGIGLLSSWSASDLGAVPSKPNILFIAIDDQNDWIGYLGGHAMAKTPNMDALAERGTAFLNAFCNAPLCNPSRTSLLFGLRPSTTGVYGLLPWPREVPMLRDRVSLPQHFAAEGYRTLSAGKIFHGTGFQPPLGKAGKGKGKQGNATASPSSVPTLRDEFQVLGPQPGLGTRPPEKLIPATPMGDHPLMDWGVWPPDNDDTKKGDYQVASWAVERLVELKDDPEGKPFFLSAGFFLPHVPCYATQKWFDLYPDDDSVRPAILEDDRSDTPRFSWYLHWYLPEPRLKWVKESGQWRNLVRSYLACTSFVDAQIGRILDALKENGLEDNTIVVLWGDHGWHLGEKGITGKNTLWDAGTRTPLIFAGPGVTAAQRTTQPVELLDIYPSLIELTGVAHRDDLEGVSLLPQLRDVTQQRERVAVMTCNQGNHAVRSERWRYIRYADGSEELYDTEKDPKEWTNLAADPMMESVLVEHRKWLPKIDRPPAPGSKHRVLTYDPETDEAVWEGETVTRRDPIPE